MIANAAKKRAFLASFLGRREFRQKSKCVRPDREKLFRRMIETHVG
jgi:hypothetical protein